MSVVGTLAISMSAALGGSIFGKVYSKKSLGKTIMAFVSSAISALFSALVLFCWDGLGNVSTFTLLLGILFGVIVATQGVMSLKAVECGPMSYTAVIVSFSTLVSALSGVAFFGESISVWQIIGIAFMLTSFVFAVEKDAEKRKASWRWLIFCLIAFCCCGGVGLMQKIHQSSEYKGELNAFLVIAFITACLLMTTLSVVTSKKEKVSILARKDDGKIDWVAILIPVCLGIMAAVNHKLNLYLSGVMPSAVFFPIVNGGGLVLTTLSAVVLFRERLSGRQWIGVGLGIASVIFLCLG